jgi:hypothetical protein
MAVRQRDSVRASDAARSADVGGIDGHPMLCNVSLAASADIVWKRRGQ